MSDSSPADLAIAFRALPRRMRDARGEVAAADVATQLAAIDRRLARAGELLLIRADASAIADAIEAVPADAWGTELDELRSIALELGRDLRSIEAANPDADH